MKGLKVAAGTLGMVCIILIVGLVWAVTIINDKNAVILNKDATISDKNGEYNDYVGTHHYTDAEYTNYVASHHYADTEYNLLQSIANLEQQQTVLNQYTTNQGANTHTLVTSFQANYAGYIDISLTSTATNAYVIVEYWYQGRLFSFQETLGTSGEVVFCLLPSSVAIYAGNRNFVGGATHTITAIYHY